MNWAVFYLVLGVLSAFFTLTALVQARSLRWFTPVWFMCGWLAGELALIHVLWQAALALLIALWPGFDQPLAQYGLGFFGLSWVGLLYLHRQAMGSPEHLQRGLRGALGDEYRSDIPVARRRLLVDHISGSSWLKPFSFSRAGVREHRDISFGEAGKRNLLDIYQPAEPRENGFPILLQVHGGGWTIGEKKEQGKPLMYHMAQRGWLCVAINYRLSPKDAFPAHIIDVKKAIAWIRSNIQQYGGNPDYIAITGGSAGGHLSSLAALTPNLVDWQPGFEDVDTRLQAAVPFYGVYDFMDKPDFRGSMSMKDFLAKHVMQSSREDNASQWQQASPLCHIGAHAPPMLIVQGTHDSLVWVEEARNFVEALRQVASEPVAYTELPGAQHAFEIFHSVRTDHTVNAVADFLEWCHAQWCEKQAANTDH